MKTLHQLDQHVTVAGEKRTDVLTLAGDNSSNLYIISAPGSYYLSGNVNGVANKSGILIQSDYVSIDLNGFSVIGTGAPSVTSGISSTHSNIRIFDGYVIGWNGVGIAVGDNAIIDHITATANSSAISAGANGVVSQCAVAGLGAGNGIAVTTNGVIAHCAANSFSSGIVMQSNCEASHSISTNNSVAGFQFGPGCVITDSTASLNTAGTQSTGFYGPGSFSSSISHCVAFQNNGPGIVVSAYCVISDSAVWFNSAGGIIGHASANTISRCVVNQNAFGSGNGITVSDASSVTDCIVAQNGTAGSAASGISGTIRELISGCNVTDNRGDGINVSGDSTIRDSKSSHNGARGIVTTGGGSRIDGNQVRDNTGIGVVVTGLDVVVRNTAGNNNGNNVNASQFSPATGTNVGLIQAANAVTSPAANIVY
ncbi:MAG: right-handed parallel beta-helix repeat-containing protein [Chthoniobacterales bacterium]|jgi:hypothetical protein